MDILRARLPQRQGLYRIAIDDRGTISSVEPMPESGVAIDADTAFLAENCVDAAGDWISLGGVDLQINGALGLAFPDAETKDLPTIAKICRFLWQQGVDAFLPTIVTSATATVRRSLAVFAAWMRDSSEKSAEETASAKILGVHLEGPFLNVKKRGAHPEAHLQPLSVENVRHTIAGYEDIVKVVTLAPELDPSGEAIAYLRDRGILVSSGHSLATQAEARQAFQRGASMVTHAFNAMPPLHHREPGLLGAAIVDAGVRCGLIADGVHVCPTAIEVFLRACHYEAGAFLVSDALSPLGLPDGKYPWDEREIEVRDGTARLPDGTLSGTTLPLLEGTSNLARWGVCEPERAIALATVSPRRAIGLPDFGVGQPASLLRWHWNAEQKALSWERLA